MKAYVQRPIPQRKYYHYLQRPPNEKRNWGYYACGNVYNPGTDYKGELYSREATTKDLEALDECPGCSYFRKRHEQSTQQSQAQGEDSQRETAN